MAQAGKSRIWWRIPTIIIFGAVAAAFWLAAAAIIAIDPYRIYAWGLPVGIEQQNYPGDELALMVDVIAKSPDIDAVLIGSSTSVDITPAQIRQIGVRHPANLSQPSIRPMDFRIVDREMVRYSRARHILHEFTIAYLAPDASSGILPGDIYDGNPLNDLRTVNLQSLRDAWAVWRHGVLPSRGFAEILRRQAEVAGEFRYPDVRRRLREKIVARRGEVMFPSTKRCDDFPAVMQELVPTVRQEARKGAAVDIFVPPYSLATYYDAVEGQVASVLGARAFGDYLNARRCLVEALDGTPGVRIFAFDNEDWITSNLDNYRDSAHLANFKVFDFMMQAIAAGTHQLHRDNIDAYLATLRTRVLAYGDRIAAQERLRAMIPEACLQVRRPGRLESYRPDHGAVRQGA